jgi:hypothetical protein
MKKKCIYWSDCGMAHGGCCGLGRYGGRPSHGTCRICRDYRGVPRGWGDWVHLAALPIAVVLRVISRGRLSPGRCGCEQRRQKWNARR